MADELESVAKRELARVDEIVGSMGVLDAEKASALLEVLRSYHSDCRGFVEKGQFLQAVEAAFICWAYVDAGLHLKVFSVPDEMLGMFTVGD
jgi:hypothetical protein